MQVKGSVRQHAYRDDTAAAIRLSAVRRSDGTALARPPHGLSSGRSHNPSLAHQRTCTGSS
jgi:hypothetical protein